MPIRVLSGSVLKSKSVELHGALERERLGRLSRSDCVVRRRMVGQFGGIKVLCQDLRISASRSLERPSQTEMVILQCGRRQSRQNGFANSVVECLGLVLLCWS